MRSFERRQMGLAAALAGGALLVTACGGSSPPGGTTASGPSQDGVQQAFKFSQCMRSHGVPEFPDPVVRTQPGRQSVGIKISPALSGSPQFKTAQHACQGILPAPNPQQIAQQQRHEREGKLSFARCMRAGGVTGFPDPNLQGELTRTMLSTAGVDVHAPAVIATAKRCVSASEGTITKADVERATSQ